MQRESPWEALWRQTWQKELPWDCCCPPGPWRGSLALLVQLVLLALQGGLGGGSVLQKEQKGLPWDWGLALWRFQRWVS